MKPTQPPTATPCVASAMERPGYAQLLSAYSEEPSACTFHETPPLVLARMVPSLRVAHPSESSTKSRADTVRKFQPTDVLSPT